MVHLDSHFDTLTVHLGALKPLLGAVGVQVAAPGDGPGLRFETLGRPMSEFFRSGGDFVEYSKGLEKPRFSIGWSMISKARRSLQSNEYLAKLSLTIGNGKNLYYRLAR